MSAIADMPALSGAIFEIVNEQLGVESRRRQRQRDRGEEKFHEGAGSSRILSADARAENPSDLLHPAYSLYAHPSTECVHA